MVPLPYHLKLGTREVVTAIIRRSDRLDVPGVRLHPDRRGSPEVSRQTKIRPAIHPGDRGSRRQPSDRVVVLHGKAPPFPGGRLDDPALMQIETQTLAGIRWADHIWRRLAPAPRAVALGASQALPLALRLHF